VSIDRAVVEPLALGMARGEIEADLGVVEHRAAVDARLREAVDGGARAWSEVLAASEGADPRLVAQRVRALALPVEGVGAHHEHESADAWAPELHARDFEWYFAPACAAELAARAAGPGRSVLCLGTPTVAFALLEARHVRRVTLVDRNPLVIRRHRDASALEARCEDLAAVRLPAGAYDVAVLDAPWYPPALRHWLAVAAAAVRPGGRILFALLQALHRPSARADRAAILACARALGTVRVEPARLRYASPRFEREALATAGLAVPEAWRHADLVELVVQHRAPAEAALGGSLGRTPSGSEAYASDPAWTRLVVGPQVIHLDPHAASGPGDALAPVDGRADFRYGSISTRDPRRADIGLWTSRSRVARVRRPAVVAALLERLAATGEHRGLVDAPALRPLPAAERMRLLAALRVIVGPLEPCAGP
jgi:SAM-dependent methyltransferase